MFKKNIAVIPVSAYLFFLATQSAMAQITNPALGEAGNRSGVSFISRLLQASVNMGLLIGSIVFVFMIIIGGINWITAGGDKVKRESARNTLTNALIGVTVVLGLFGIINLVESFLGVDITTFNTASLMI